ncbi:MAG: potassium channel family protein [Dehalococcoidia bacterium]|nr:potassium channel family protein [Dehalococcoidia bacterium]
MPRRVVVKSEALIGFLAVLSIFIVVLGNMMLAAGRVPVGVYTVDAIICVVFAWDFAKRLRKEHSARAFLKKYWYELLAMIPAVVLDMVVGLPILSVGLRALRLVRFARIVLNAARLKRTVSVADRFIDRSQLFYLIIITAGLVIAAAFAVLAIEFRFVGSPIKTVSDALWWSLATVTTVGYGDIVPATALGRIIGMLLMIVGIGAMATLISQVSAVLVESRLQKVRHIRRSKSTIDAGTIAGLQEAVGRVAELTDAELAGLLHRLIEAHDLGRTSRGEGVA